MKTHPLNTIQNFVTKSLTKLLPATNSTRIDFYSFCLCVSSLILVVSLLSIFMNWDWIAIFAVLWAISFVCEKFVKE